jgi:hypothetical protein
MLQEVLIVDGNLSRVPGVILARKTAKKILLAQHSTVIPFPFFLFPHPPVEARPARAYTRRRRWNWRAAQLALPFTMPTKVVTPLMQMVFDVVKRVAAARSPMPSNIRLGEMLEGRGRQSVAKALNRLAVQRKISMEQSGGQRRVLVIALGHTTGWGDHRIGHAPYSRTSREEFKSRPEVIAPRALSLGDGLTFLGINPAHETAFRAALTRPERGADSARSCQYMADDAGVCGDRSMPGKSWCGAHYKIVFGKR